MWGMFISIQTNELVIKVFIFKFCYAAQNTEKILWLNERSQLKIKNIKLI